MRGTEDPNSKLFSAVDTRKLKETNSQFWALKDINIEVEQGDLLGIIGRNGAGKSTLLKILSRVTAPSKGLIKVRGRIASLLEVGTGFHPELTGRENIFLNGSILGMSRDEIKKKFDEIVDFAGVTEFVDTPVKRYSSGMHVRLAFAVAAHLEPEILVVDEVLAVGDMEFQNKCLGKMSEVSREGRTILFVSHDMSAVKRLCRTGIVLNDGEVEYSGKANDVVDHYIESSTVSCDSSGNVKGGEIWQNVRGRVNKDDPFITVNSIFITDNDRKICTVFNSNDPIFINFDFKINKKIGEFRIIISILGDNGEPILTSQLTDTGEYLGSLEAGRYQSCCCLPDKLFSSRQYKLRISFLARRLEHHIYDEVISFKVMYDNASLNKMLMDNVFFRPYFKWNLNKMS